MGTLDRSRITNGNESSSEQTFVLNEGERGRVFFRRTQATKWRHWLQVSREVWRGGDRVHAGPFYSGELQRGIWSAIELADSVVPNDETWKFTFTSAHKWHWGSLRGKWHWSRSRNNGSSTGSRALFNWVDEANDVLEGKFGSPDAEVKFSITTLAETLERFGVTSQEELEALEGNARFSAREPDGEEWWNYADVIHLDPDLDPGFG